MSNPGPKPETDAPFPDCSFEGTREWQRERARRMTDLEKIRWLQDTLAEIGPWIGAARENEGGKK